MEEFITNLYSNSTTPVWSAALLGLLTAISPCPMATNITAIGFISRDLENKNRVFFNGLIYTLGRAITYTGLAFLLFLGADKFKLSGVFQQYGEKILGPLLILIGLFMLDIIRFRIPGFSGLTKYFQTKEKKHYLDALLLGVLFALAFCPYSGVLYFGMLVPLTIQSASGLLLPFVFAVVTGIPVILFAWLFAYTLSGVGKLYNQIQRFEYWFRKAIAVLFIGVGLYYTLIIWL